MARAGHAIKPLMAEGERQQTAKVVADFKGMNTQADRTAIDDDEFAWLEGIIPVGRGNLLCVPNANAVLQTFPVQCNQFQAANIGGVDYVYGFGVNGALYQVNNMTGAMVTVATPGTFSTSAAMNLTQWTNDRILIGDPANGLYSWDGTVLSPPGGAVVLDFQLAGSLAGTGYAVNDIVGLPGGNGAGAQGRVTAVSGSGQIVTAVIQTPGANYNTGSAPFDYLSTVSGGTGTGAKLSVRAMAGPPAIATLTTFAGRLWTATARTVSFSGTVGFWDFTSANAGGSFIVTDVTLHKNINSLDAANNFLYITGDTSINVLGDVQVLNGITVFSNVNITASVGSNLQNTFTPYLRLLLFANSYGVHAVNGATPQKISDQMDGVFKLIDFTQPFSAAQCVIFNLLCAVFLFTYKDPIQGTRPLMALFFNKKWFVATQASALTLLTTSVIGGQLTAFGTDGQKIYQLFAAPAAAISTKLQSKLFDMGDPVQQKQALMFGMGVVSATGVQTAFTCMADNENSSVPVALPAAGNQGNWQNNALVQGQWQNNTPTLGSWLGGGYTFLMQDVQQAGRYLGFTLTSTAAGFKVTLLATDFEFLGRWGT